MSRASRKKSGELIVAEVDPYLAAADGAERLAGVFNRLAHQLREARLLRQQNEQLREENAELREALGECVEACDRFLGPTINGSEMPDEDDRVRARLALEAGRRALGRGRLPG